MFKVFLLFLTTYLKAFIGQPGLRFIQRQDPKDPKASQPLGLLCSGLRYCIVESKYLDEWRRLVSTRSIVKTIVLFVRKMVLSMNLKIGLIVIIQLGSYCYSFPSSKFVCWKNPCFVWYSTFKSGFVGYYLMSHS